MTRAQTLKMKGGIDRFFVLSHCICNQCRCWFFFTLFSLKSELEKVKREKAALELELNKAKENQLSAETQLSAQQQQNAHLQHENGQLKQQTEPLIGVCNKLERENSALRAQLEDLRQQLERLAEEKQDMEEDMKEMRESLGQIERRRAKEVRRRLSQLEVTP